MKKKLIKEKFAESPISESRLQIVMVSYRHPPNVFLFLPRGLFEKNLVSGLSDSKF